MYSSAQAVLLSIASHSSDAAVWACLFLLCLVFSLVVRNRLLKSGTLLEMQFLVLESCTLLVWPSCVLACPSLLVQRPHGCVCECERGGAPAGAEMCESMYVCMRMLTCVQAGRGAVGVGWGRGSERGPFGCFRGVDLALAALVLQKFRVCAQQALFSLCQARTLALCAGSHVQPVIHFPTCSCFP